MEQNKALLERIRLFVLDLDGTIYLGDRLLPGAAEFITTAKEKGRQVLFFTNNTSRSPMEYVERLSRMGIPVTQEDILTAGDVTIHYLQTHCAGQSVYLLGVPALRQSFAEAGISGVADVRGSQAVYKGDDHYVIVFNINGTLLDVSVSSEEDYDASDSPLIGTYVKDTEQ